MLVPLFRNSAEQIAGELFSCDKGVECHFISPFSYGIAVDGLNFKSVVSLSIFDKSNTASDLLFVSRTSSVLLLNENPVFKWC